MSNASRKFSRHTFQQSNGHARHSRRTDSRPRVTPEPPTITLTPEQDALLEQTMEADRRYFRENPSAREYVRSFREGESAGVEMDTSRVYMVRVTKISEGIRNREIIEMPEVEEREKPVV